MAQFKPLQGQFEAFGCRIGVRGIHDTDATAFYRRTVYGHRVKKNVIICARLDLYVK